MVYTQVNPREQIILYVPLYSTHTPALSYGVLPLTCWYCIMLLLTFHRLTLHTVSDCSATRWSREGTCWSRAISKVIVHTPPALAKHWVIFSLSSNEYSLRSFNSSCCHSNLSPCSADGITPIACLHQVPLVPQHLQPSHHTHTACVSESILCSHSNRITLTHVQHYVCHPLACHI